MQPTLEMQAKSSILPDNNQLLIEKTPTREGDNWFIFPFAGRLANEGLAALVSYRLSKLLPLTISLSFNDYGFHLCSNAELDLGIKDWKSLLSPEDLVDELLHCMNSSEMSKRQFREIARLPVWCFKDTQGHKSQSAKYRHPVVYFSMFSKNTILTTCFSPNPEGRF